MTFFVTLNEVKGLLYAISEKVVSYTEFEFWAICDLREDRAKESADNHAQMGFQIRFCLVCGQECG
jgi:hypothetical protein